MLNSGVRLPVVKLSFARCASLSMNCSLCVCVMRVVTVVTFCLLPLKLLSLPQLVALYHIVCMYSLKKCGVQGIMYT